MDAAQVKWKLPSASKLGLAFKCVGSVILPHVIEEGGEAAEEGKRKHATLETFFKSGRSVDGLSEGDRELCERVARTVGDAECEFAESGLAINPVDWTAESYLPERSGHSNAELSDAMGVLGGIGNYIVDSNGGDYGRGVSGSGYEAWRARRFVSVVDYMSRRSDGSYSIWDWKNAQWVPDPQYNWQLVLPAIALWIIGGRASDFVCDMGIVYTRIPDDLAGDVLRHTSFRATSGFLASADRALAGLWRRILNSEPESVTLYEGKHCQYCPARHRCPAIVGAFTEAIGNFSLSKSDISDDSIVRISRSLIDCGPQLKKMEINILRSNGGELYLGDGRVAVLTKDGRGRDKVYTRRAKQERSDASESENASGEGSGTEGA